MPGLDRDRISSMVVGGCVVPPSMVESITAVNPCARPSTTCPTMSTNALVHHTHVVHDANDRCRSQVFPLWLQPLVLTDEAACPA